VPAGAHLRLGQALALAEARARVAFPVLTPDLPELGAPDEVYLSDPPAGGQVTLVYRAGPGRPVAAGETGVALLLAQFRALDIFVGKGLGPGTRLEELTVNGGRGYWIEGGPHLLVYRDASGAVRDEMTRLAGNVLLWEQGGQTLRLEGALTKEAALRVAASLR
jgi:hypothetical protein